MTTNTLSKSKRILLLIVTCCGASLGAAQVNVTTFHNDNFRTGQNTAETVLTTSNVNSSQFGKLFSVAVDGYVYAQPLYLAKVTISGGTHNVLYIATEHDSVYAIDADNGAVLWQQSFINPGAGITTVSSSDVACTDLVPEVGITSTPVIDPATGTIYVVARTKENGSYVQRLHALDVVTHAEKFGGPKVISATFQGRTFDPLKQNNRPGLLLENGHVVITWASHCDNGPYQGWVMSYSASTLAQEAVFNTELNTISGYDGGVWMSGDGVAADANGNLYLATGNGDYNGSTDFGDTILKLTGPANGTFSAADWFTPFNQSSFNGSDTDVGAGGVLLLPDLPVGSAHQQLLVQMGKEGKIYLIDRNNMGKFCSTCTSIDTNIVQEIPGASTGIWGSPAFWNNTVFWGGGKDGGSADHIKAWSFNANSSGLLSTSPVSETSQVFSFSTAAPVISANGTSNGILWILDNSSFASSCCQVLYAFSASNLGTMLYNSNQAANSRDVPGGAVKFTAPVVANGKVYVGSQGKISAFGILSTTPVAAAPTFSPAPGTYTTSVTVTLSDTTSGATIHCTTNGTTPTASSPVCSSVTISSTTLLQAIAVASGFSNSPVTSGTYSIVSGSGINYGAGFTSTGLALNGSAAINGTRLRLTNGGTNQAASAFSNSLISVQNFTTDFSFQLTNPNADGMTFTIQGTGTTALGPSGGGLGYGPDSTSETPGIGKSIAVKFDLYSNAGEGNDSTGLYTNGASPTVPAIDMTSSGVNLHSGDVFNVHMTYDGTTLKMTITDASFPSETFSASWTINIPATVGNTAYIGFTAGTGSLTATQEIITWTYASSLPTAAAPTFSPVPGTYTSAQSVTLSDTTSGATIHYTTDGSTPSGSSTTYTSPISVTASETIKAIATASGYNNSPVATGVYMITNGNSSVNFANGFSATGMTFNGFAALNGTRLRLTNGGTTEAGSGFYNTPVNVQTFATDFSFQLTNPNADGMTFVLQNTGTRALGASGGALGYTGIGKSVAVKFDLYNNAGEGTNSTGLYINGASPTTPAVTLGGGVDLHSGDVFNVHITYDGTTLTMTITDASVPADTFTTSWPVNIPGTVGANTAFAGFTGGTGALTATQEIISWTFTPGVSKPIQYEAETVPSTGVPDARVFSWSGFTDGSGIIVDATQAGNYIAFVLNIPQAGTYDVKYASQLLSTRGIGQLSVGGVNVGPAVDQYASTSSGIWKEFDIGNVTFTAAGSYQFKFTVTGKNASSSGYSLTFDYIKLTPQ
jgi:hypothetical protein